MHETYTRRPNFLNRGPGLLESLYAAWVKASQYTPLNLFKAWSQSTSPSKEPQTLNVIKGRDTCPNSVDFINDHIIAIKAEVAEKIVRPFCNLTKTPDAGLYFGVAKNGYIGLRRERIENMLEKANAIFLNFSGADSETHKAAHAFMIEFEFLYGLKELPTHSVLSLPTRAPYKTERHIV